MKKIYTILILLSLAGCGKKKEYTISHYTNLSPHDRVNAIDTSFFEPFPNSVTIDEVDVSVIVNGREYLQYVDIAFTPLSGDDIGKAEGER